MQRLVNLTSRRSWLVVGVAVAFLLVSVVAGGSLSSQLNAGGFADPDTEAFTVSERVEDLTGVTPEASVIALIESDRPVRSPEGIAGIEAVRERLAADEAVATVTTALDPGGEALISTDGTDTYLIASFKPLSDDAGDEAAGRIVEAFEDDDNVLIGGTRTTFQQASEIIESDLTRAELIAFPIILLLSLWVFRGFIAALMPVLVGVFTIFGSFLIIGLINQATPISIFALNLIIGLGLGLSIDYSLLIVSRYREEIAAQGPGVKALLTTLRTAGKSVVFSAITVAAALAGLMVFPQNFLFSMGIGGVVAAGVALVTSVVLLPAVLALLGSRVNSLSPAFLKRQSEDADKPLESGFWYRLSHAIAKRPGIIAIVTAAALILVALPAFGITFTAGDANILPTSASAREVSDTLTAEFPEDRSTPVIVLADAPVDPGSRAQLTAYTAELGELPGAAGVIPPEPIAEQPGVWRIQVLPAGQPLDDAATTLVDDVRAADAPFPVEVGGFTAGFLDEQDSLAAHLPIAIAIVAIVTIVALFMMTGSVILPIKAVIMNLLTLGATLGLLVLIFQDGRFETLLDYDSRGALDMTQPILLGAIAFGLSTDYAVFLLSRIKEARDNGASDTDAVAIGLQRTGRIVTAAALLFAVAIGAFATSEIILIKELGVGTALAVLIDATIIRALLVPSLMALMGKWNWWAPGPLRRFHDRFGFDETEPPRDPEPSTA